MGKPKDSGRIEMSRIIEHAQKQILANLAASEIFEHPTARGAATERHWIDLFNNYLPERYRATSAFIIDADGNRSRQIDIAIYDRFYSPLLFHHDNSLFRGVRHRQTNRQIVRRTSRICEKNFR